MSKEFTNNDLINRKLIIEKIDYLIDTLPLDSKFCLALNGKWGSGKSYIMNMLSERFEDAQEYIVVHYDAWKNNFYSDPMIAILYCILDELKQYKIAHSSNKCKKIVKSITKEVCVATINTISESCEVFAKAIGGIKKVIKACQNADLTNNKNFGDYKSYLSLLKETIEILNEITSSKIIKNKQSRLVVLVDEIDRCLPSEQLLVLERLHHIFAVKNSAVIVALNKEAIVTNFNLTYGGDGNEYLRKFFNYTFVIKTNELILLKNRMKDIFEIINNKRSCPIKSTEMDFIINDILGTAKEIFCSTAIDNRLIVAFVDTAIRVLEEIVDYQPIMILFALRILLYKMFSKQQYQRIVSPLTDEENLFQDLQQFNVHVIVRSYISYFGVGGELRIAQYGAFYNILLALFNLSKIRNIESWQQIFRDVIAGPLEKNGISIIDAQQNIADVYNAIDRYGEM